MMNVYSDLKFLQFTDKIRAIRERRITPPIHVRIKPTNHCNHACWYCAYRTDDLQLGEDIDLKDRIPTDKMHEIIDDMLGMEVRAITFSGGGEPMLYKPLPDCVERLANGGIRVASLTNGSNLKGRMAEIFARFGTWIRVSIDGWDDDSYCRMRGARAGSFSKLLENMKMFLASGTKCALGVSFIISKENAGHIFETCRLFKSIGVSHVKLAAAVVGNAAAENNGYHREFRDVAATQIRRAKTLTTAEFAIVDHYHEMEDRFDKRYGSCHFSQFLTVIGADSNVYTCQDKAYTDAGRLGEIKDRSFKEFWFSEENRKRINDIDPSVVCRHHCVANGKNLALDEILNLRQKHACFV